MRWPLVIAFVVSVFLAGLLYWVLQKTDLGRSIRAVHQNARAAALVGINVMAVRTITFAAGFGILAIAAALLLPGTPAHPGMGLRYTVITLMVIMLGGMTTSSASCWAASSSASPRRSARSTSPASPA